jgi:hypothetical protein
MPPPIIRAVGFTGTTLVGISSNSCALEIPAFINSIAFNVALSRISFA